MKFDRKMNNMNYALNCLILFSKELRTYSMFRNLLRPSCLIIIIRRAESVATFICQQWLLISH
jgi:hypothetical protein